MTNAKNDNKPNAAEYTLAEMMKDDNSQLSTIAKIAGSLQHLIPDIMNFQVVLPKVMEKTLDKS